MFGKQILVQVLDNFGKTEQVFFRDVPYQGSYYNSYSTYNKMVKPLGTI